MSAHTEVTQAALENQAFALMGRMHVILRRQNGRVTDIEYMRTDPVYCRHLLDMAAKLPNEDLHQIGEKLAEVFFGEEGLFVRARANPPLLSRLTGTTPSPAPSPAKPAVDVRITMPAPVMPAPVVVSSNANATVDRAYIGRLR